MKHIVDHVEAGKPTIGIRTSTHAFFYRQNPESPYGHWSWNAGASGGGFGKEVLGETWVNRHGHHGVEATRGLPHPGSESHPGASRRHRRLRADDVYGIEACPMTAPICSTARF